MLDFEQDSIQVWFLCVSSSNVGMQNHLSYIQMNLVGRNLSCQNNALQSFAGPIHKLGLFWETCHVENHMTQSWHSQMIKALGK